MAVEVEEYTKEKPQKLSNTNFFSDLNSLYLDLEFFNELIKWETM